MVALREAREQPLHLPAPRDDRLRAVARQLQADPADNTSLAGLGRAAGASARTLSRLFRDQLGMTGVIGTTPGRYRSSGQS